MRNTIQTILSTILIGIPEMTFIFMVSLAILKSIANIRVNKVKTGILVITSAVFLNANEIFNLDRFLALLFTIVTVIAFTKLVTQKAGWKVLLAALGGCAAFVFTEGIFGGIVISALHITEEMMVKNVFIAVGGSSPERVIQFLLLYIFSLNQIKRLFSPKAENVRIFAVIRHSVFYRKCFIGSFLFAILVNGMIGTVCTRYDFLVNTPFILGISFLIVTMVISVVPILLVVLQIYYSVKNIKAYLKFAALNIKINTSDIYEAAVKANDIRTLRSARRILEIVNKLDENTN
jgi:hypothetical protein